MHFIHSETKNNSELIASFFGKQIYENHRIKKMLKQICNFIISSTKIKKIKNVKINFLMKGKT
jgi:hypothetical protein